MKMWNISRSLDLQAWSSRKYSITTLQGLAPRQPLILKLTLDILRQQTQISVVRFNIL